MLSLSAAVTYGAVGGLITEASLMSRWLEAWRQARHEAVTHRKKRPGLTMFIDPVADLAVALTRAGLGAVAGWLLHDQLTGVYAALTVGASAPAVLAALGRAVTPASALAGRQQEELARPSESGPGHQPEMVE